jgi:signal transduction histidine kinase/DNA-binding response OmpR family regulator/ligand-binding sensor domain-containing protein
MTKKMRGWSSVFLMLWMLIATSTAAQQKYDVEHFGIEDGMPQKAVMDILQDKKGFIWFTNWDGICKFDGSVFHSYDLNKQNRRLMRNQMYLDKFGYIWVKSHENEIYRFDPWHEKFDDLKAAAKNYTAVWHPRRVLTMASGKTWLFDGIKGCICIEDSAFKPIFLNAENHLLLNNTINNIYEDQQRNSWVLTDNGIYLFAPDMQARGAYFTSGTAFFSAIESDQEIWFGSEKGNVIIYDKETKKFRRILTGANAPITILKNIDRDYLLVCSSGSQFFIYNKKKQALVPFDLYTLSGRKFKNISSVFLDHQQNIWIQTDFDEAVKFDLLTQKLHLYPVQRDKQRNFQSPYSIWQDVNDRIWINSGQAGFVSYDSQSDRLIPLANQVSPEASYFSSIIYAGFSDKQGNLWLSTRTQGIEKVSFSDAAYKFDHIDPDSNHNVRSIMEDNLHRLWVATKDGKINIYTAGLERTGWLTEDGTIGRGKPLGRMAYSMIQDAEGNIWIGTKGDGIFKLIPESNGKKYKVNHFIHNPADPYSLSDNKVYHIFADSHNRIWIGTYTGGLNLADQSKPGRFYNYNNQFKNYPIHQCYHVRTINEDHSGKLYVGTTQGLLVLPSDIASGSFTGYKYYDQGLNNNSWGANDVYDVCVTSTGDIYIATFGGGINRVAEKDASGFPKRFYNYSTKNGLVSNLVLQIKEDAQHRLWIVGESSLMRFNPRNQMFENYDDVSKQIKEEIFAEGGDINTSFGKMMLGTTGGFVVINTAQINPDNFKPYVALTGLQLTNREISIGPASPLTQDIDDIRNLKLNHKQNFINLEFAALDFKTAGQTRYAYKLDGVDSGWVETKERSAKYINLSPGRYRFHVRSTNRRGLWLDNEHTLPITIVPAFWQTNWAIILYIIAVLGLVFFIMRSVVIFFRLKDRLALEHEQTEMKSVFFTDISHEIRTPLTMIVTPVEDILEFENISDNVGEQLKLVLKNAKRMLRLVNQILDFRKIQHQLLTLQETSIGPFVTSIVNDFQKTANTAGIRLIIQDETHGDKIFIDRESIDKMMYNLLSNAFKHTPKGGSISVCIFSKDEKIAVQVSDNGTGMPAEIIQKLFKRFISYNADKSKPSTGIGLSIVREIIERHSAEITVDSAENKGSVFTAHFLKGTTHFKDAENVVITRTDLPETEPISTHGKSVTEEPASLELNSILLVEDDGDLRKYIASLLMNKYRLFEASDGQQALDIALREVPDFIISDIMMPGMDGIELLREIRKQTTTSHIPMIMLTAKVNRDTELSVYDLGADAYITKPFSAKILQLRIKTILEQRKKLYLHLKDEDRTETPVVTKHRSHHPDLNQQFIATVKEEIEKNISNHHFTVDNLIATMPMSRSVFVKKLKSLTGLSPVEYMRVIKFQHAAKLIDTNQYTIKEVSYMIGIHDTKYFSARFKEIMGVLPSEYKKGSVHN